MSYAVCKRANVKVLQQSQGIEFEPGSDDHKGTIQQGMWVFLKVSDSLQFIKAPAGRGFHMSCYIIVLQSLIYDFVLSLYLSGALLVFDQ